MAGKNGIAIKYINARLLESRTFDLIKFHYVPVVAYAPTKEAPEGQKAKYMATLQEYSSISARWAKHLCFDRREGGDRRKCKGRGEADIMVSVAYGRDVLHETANYSGVSQKTTSSLF